VDRSLLRLLLRWIWPYRWLALLGMVLTIPAGSLDALIAAFLRPYVDHVVLGQNLVLSVQVPLAIILFTVVQGILTYSSAYVNTWVGNRIALDVRKIFFHRLLAMDGAYLDGLHSGEVLLRFSSDVDLACAGLIQNLRLFFTRIFSMFFLCCVLIYNSWWLALIAIAILGCAFWPVRLVRHKIASLTAANQASLAASTAFYGESFAGSRTIAAYNLQRKREQGFAELMQGLFRMAMRIARHSNWLTPAMHLIVSIGLAGVLALGGWLVASGRMSNGSFTSFIAALLLLYTPIKSLGNNLTAFQGSLLAAGRLQGLLDLEPRIAVEFSEALEPLPFHRAIAFESVSFSYREGLPVLSDVCFTIPVGQTIGIVGSSGGGKTTLIHLLLRLYDVQEGRITLDGVDIRELSTGRLRQSMAMVFQDNFLFSASIRENILLGRPDASAEALGEAVNAAFLADFIASLPDGLDTPVGERGMLLSGGQKQRIAIARALLKDAPIVILDEATSSLDNFSEAIVRQALQNLTAGRTVLIVAHRLSSIAHADRILVIEGGRVVENGSHGELLAIPDGFYARLYRHQEAEQRE
jgi:subfamily B ATP-binding cassette protein MsbA